MNLTGSIDLLKLEKTGIATIKNKKCVIIPIEENDATRALKVDSVSKTFNCESNLDCAGSIKMEHETKSKSKSHRTARPLEEMLSEVIDTYLTLGRKQRQEIAVLLY